VGEGVGVRGREGKEERERGKEGKEEQKRVSSKK